MRGLNRQLHELRERAMTDTSELLDSITPKQTATVNVLERAVWQTADDFLRLIVPAENYGDYIIPFTVLRLSLIHI